MELCVRFSGIWHRVGIIPLGQYGGIVLKFWGAAGWQLIRLKISAGQFKTARPLHFPYTPLPFLHLFPPTQAMAHPTPNRPLPPLRLLTHGVSSLTVHHPASGEIIMLRFPLQIPSPGSFISPSAITGSTNNNYHPCIVLKSHMTGNSWILDLSSVVPSPNCLILSPLSLV